MSTVALTLPSLWKHLETFTSEGAGNDGAAVSFGFLMAGAYGDGNKISVSVFFWGKKGAERDEENEDEEGFVCVSLPWVRRI